MVAFRLVPAVALLVAGCGRFSFEDDPPGDDAPPAPRLIIEIDGSGDGMVVGPDGIQCETGTCSIDTTLGATITLRGLAATESWLAGWSGPCGGNFDCTITIQGDVTVNAEFGPLPNRTFVTSDVHDGNFGSIAAADAMCATAATNAGLTGTFVAYLSDASSDAINRLSGSRGWIRTDGAPVIDIASEMADGPVIFPLRLDELGVDLGRVDFYTGTRAGGGTDSDCLGWTSNLDSDLASLGISSWGSMVAWDATGGDACNELRHVLCMETGRNVMVTPKPDTGRMAFLSVNRWTPGNGRASADAVCSGEAAAAGLAGTFLAAMATSTESIAARFTPGMPWRRVDDVRLLRRDGMFATDFLDVAPEIDLSGQLIADDYWTGARRWNAPSSASCGDWSVGDAASLADVHFTSQTDVTDAAKQMECNVALPLLCLQQ